MILAGCVLTPVSYVYHNLEFSKYVGRGEPV